TANQNVFAFMRRNGASEVVVLLNLSPNHTYIQLPDGYVHGTYSSVFSGARLDIIPNHSFELNAWDYIVLEK
ncbi:MAG: alpha-glucosidase C-terminal domain-containing protein, partial [Chitinophagaceae bacterium]